VLQKLSIWLWLVEVVVALIKVAVVAPVDLEPVQD
jgi:hypothetical protein